MDFEGKNLVSIIVPTQNRAELLLRAIESIVNQTYHHWECLVVDDGSVDNTAQIIESNRDSRIHFFRHDDIRGASAARNTGISHARGSFVAFLDDDDEWLPTKLEKQLNLIQRLSTDYGMVYCWMDYYDSRGDKIKEHHPLYRDYVFPYVLDEQRIGGCPTLLVRRTVMDELGGFDETLLRGNDGDFIRRVCRNYLVDFVPEALVRVNVDHGHLRISNTSEKGLKNAIRGESIKLDKFKSELRKYPIQTANIYSKIGHHYFQVGNLRMGASFHLRAFVTAPFFPKLYRRFLGSIYHMLVH